MEEDKAIGDSGMLKAAIRSTKKSNQPSKIGVPARRANSSKGAKRGKVTGGTSSKGMFYKDFDQQSRRLDRGKRR